MTSHPLFSVIVPTIGRPTLLAALESLAAQRLAQYLQVIVVPDTHNRAVSLPMMPQGFASIEVLDHDAGFSAWGHPQRNFVMDKTHGMWVATLDDDDIWVPNALDLIISGVSNSPKTFNIFRMQHAKSGVTIWNNRYPSEGNVGTPMMVWRKDSPVGKWGPRYAGDFDFLVSTIHVLPNGVDDLYWHEPVIATIRPAGTPDEVILA